MRRMLLLLCLVAACDREPAGPPPVGEALVDARRAACEKDGGRWGSGGAGGLMICYRDTADAGRPCAAAGDCDGLCLARSRTCAPVVPLFGCHEALGDDGRAARVCTE